MVQSVKSDNPHHPAHWDKARDDCLGIGVHVYLVTNFRLNTPYVSLTCSTHLEKL